MSKSAIEWTDETWNPVTGCTRISPGCALCYAKTLHDMRHKAHAAGKKIAPTYATPFETVVLHPERLNSLPIGGAPRRVFVNSMSDLFHDDVPYEFIDQVFAAMALRPHMTFQILTKRAQRMMRYIAGWDVDTGHVAIRVAAACGRMRYSLGAAADVNYLMASLPLKNVWLGVSVENQKCADERIPWLLKTPAAVRFLSIEPMLGPVDLTRVRHSLGKDSFEIVSVLDGNDGFALNAARKWVDWVIVGGESGAGARPMHPDWARGIRDQCQAACVPFFFKQWGAWAPVRAFNSWPKYRDEVACHAEKGDVVINFDGSRPKNGGPEGKVYPLELMRCETSGRLLDGREWNEFPAAVVEGATR